MKTATLYLRRTREPYEKVVFKSGKPVVPRDYNSAFYLRVSEDGKRKWVSYSTLEEALSQRQKMTDNITKGLRPSTGLDSPVTKLSTPRTSGDSLTIEDAVAEFIEYSESRVQDWRNGGDNGLSPNSVVAYRKAMEDFEKSCKEVGAVRVSELKDPARGKAVLLNFKSWLNRHCGRRSGKGAYADSRKFTIIGAFLSRNGIKMKRDRTFNPSDPGILDWRDVPSVRKPGIGDTVYYTPSDIKAMLAAADSVHEKSLYFADDLRDLVLTFFWTGMRDEEIQHLTWADVNGKITVQDKPQYDWRVKDHEKRSIKIPPELAKRLKDRREGKGMRAPRDGSELLFPTRNGTPNQNFADHIGALQERAAKGIGQKRGKPYQFSRPEVRTHILHNFRKTYATFQMLKGETPRNIQRDLGHYDLDTTERYLALVDEPETVRAEFESIK